MWPTTTDIIAYVYMVYMWWVSVWVAAIYNVCYNWVLLHNILMRFVRILWHEGVCLILSVMTTYMTLIAAIVCVSIPDLTMIMSNVPFFNYMLIFQVPGIDLFLKKVFLPCCTDLSMHPLFFTAGLGSCSIFGIIIFYEMIAKKLYHFFSNLFLKNVKTQALYIL